MESETGIEVIPVDYDSMEALTTVLEDHKVEIVISTLFVTFDGTPQVNLVHAAEASTYTRRFIPSIWGILYSRE